MKKFVSRITLFSILTLAVVILLELSMYYVPNEHMLKRDRLINEGGSITTLVLGHSQTYHGINPDILGHGAFNCAIPIQPPYFDMKILEEFVEYMPNLECVIWPIGSFDILTAHPTPYYARDYRNYTICMMDKYFGYSPDGGSRLLFWFETIWSHWKGPFLLRPFNACIECYDNGWAPINSKDSNEDFARTPITHRNPFSVEDEARFQDENITYASKLAKICADHNIRLAVITMPCHESYTSMVDNQDIDNMNRVIDSMTKAYPRLEYYNYMSDSRFKQEDFFDKTHLNINGANKISAILREDLFD